MFRELYIVLGMLIVVCFCEQATQKYDDDKDLYYEETTMTKIEKVVVEDGGAKAKVDEEKSSSTGITAEVSSSSVGIKFEKKKYWRKITKYEKKGGRLELPVFESCMLDKECRQDVLNGALRAVKNGIGGNELKQIN